MSLEVYALVPNKCDCHPETCSCPDYTVLFHRQVLARGNNKWHLERMVERANAGYAPRADVCVVCNEPLPPVADWSTPCCPRCTEKQQASGGGCP